jgi:D-2-hydroxyacid dehydrogenase (NADP+)
MAPPSPRPPVLALNLELASESLARIREAAGGWEIVERTALKQRPELLDRAEVLFTHLIQPARVAAAQNLRWVQTYSAGVEWLLTPELRARGELALTNTRGIHAQPIAEHVFGMMLAFTRNLHGAVKLQLQQRWEPEPLRRRMSSLDGKTLAILGLGAIGRRVAQIGAAFGMNVLGYRRSAGSAAFVERVYGEGELLELLARADFLINALPETATTHKLVGARELAALPAHAVVINIGRGATMDTPALVEALRGGKLAFAGLDVTDPEPLPADHPLWSMENVLITPHYAGAHLDYQERAVNIFLNNLARYQRGEALDNLVDKDAGY